MIEKPVSSIAARRVTVAAVASALLAVVSPAAVEAQAPVLHHDPPLPPPCAVDGVCRPKRDTYGYYPTRWRRWVGDFDSAGPGGDQEGSVLQPVPDVPPEEEDREAPPPSEEVESPELDATGGDGPLPAIPPALDRLPPGGAEGAGDDQPPFAPFPPRPAGASRNGRVPAAGGAPSLSTVKLRWERSLDTPPPMPAGLPLASSMAEGRRGDAPPALPWNGGPSLRRPLVRADRPAATPRRVLPAVADRPTDGGVVPATAPPSARKMGRRAFYQPDTPPPFPSASFR